MKQFLEVLGMLCLVWTILAVDIDTFRVTPCHAREVTSYSSNLESLALEKTFVRKRFSSFNTTGGNTDNVRINAGTVHVLAQTNSAGCIRHIWCTIGQADKDGKPEKYYLRKMIIRMYWDGADKPSVEVPIGDFFGMGHAKRTNFVSAPLQMSPDNGSGFNCWFPMPFADGFRIEVENQCDNNMKMYFYIDWEEYDSLDEDLLRFHASWNREITKGISDKGVGQMEFQDAGVNISGDDNYTILEATGKGHYVGCNVNIHNQRWSWYWDWPGEGDDMIFIDGEAWPPQIHGTGTEDYFNSAFCPTQQQHAPYHGVILTGGVNWRNFITYYRYHILDPIPFAKSIRVTIEHGHANRRYDDWSSTAYWYQKGIGDISRLPPVEARLPLNTKFTWKALVAYVVLWPVYKIIYAM